MKRGAEVAVDQCLAVKQGESVLVVCDEPCREVGEVLWQVASERGAEAQLMVMLPRTENGEEPPAAVAAAMLHADVVYAPTSKSLTHTDARRAASQAGARVATLPGITAETMGRALLADHAEISRLTDAVITRMQGASSVRVTNPAGTDITFSVAGREFHEDVGLLSGPGITNLPAGEAYAAPVEGTGQGVVAVDGSIGESGILDSPVFITVVDGVAREITGNPYAATLQRAMDAVGPKARNLAELGIGTNPAATLCGSVLEDEKILGTVHLAFGDNASMGGTVSVPYHQDGILLSPSVWMDGEQIMNDGRLLV